MSRDLPTVICDTREPAVEAGDHPDALFRPFIFGPCPRDTPYDERPRLVLPTVRAKLDVGDYSLPGLEARVAIERKSGADLLGTLFGGGEDSCGERAANLDRFRAELERAQGHDAFCIVCEADRRWVWAEARRRFERYGKSFDPMSVFNILRSFAVDLNVETVWCGSRGAAEEEVGARLVRVWEQATGGPAARKAAKRKYAIPWLGALDGVVPEGTAA